MKYAKGTPLYYIPLDHMPCMVVHVTPFYENDDPHAFYTVELPNSDLRNVPVALADQYLTEEEPKKRPELQQVVRKPGILSRIFGARKTGAGKAGIFALALLCSVSAFSQSGEPVSDTSYITKQGNLFYETKMSVYQDGSEITTKTLIGDTTALVQAAKDRLTSRATSMAVDVRYVSTFRKQFSALLRESDVVLALTGIDPQKAVQNENAAPFLQDGWKIKRDGATSDIAFTVNGQGALRYSINAGATKAALLIGSALRLKNYPSNGTDTDLFVLPGGVWVDATRSTVLRPHGNNSPVNRAATPAPAPTKTTKKG